LLSRLNERLTKRLQEERDLVRRQAIFGFPQRMALLKEPLLSFLQEAYGVKSLSTSGVFTRYLFHQVAPKQAIPIDRLMDRFADSFRLDRFSTRQ